MLRDLGINPLIIMGGHDYRVAGKEKTGVGPVSYATVASLQFIGTKYSRTPLIRKLVIWNANYPDQLDPSNKLVEKFTKLTCNEMTGYRISTVQCFGF
jgi:hypothetical protein